VFKRCVEVKCPDGSVAAVADTERQFPEKVRCWTETNGDYTEEYLDTISLEKTTFYKLNDRSDSVPYGQTA